jgi:hypothetical protein
MRRPIIQAVILLVCVAGTWLLPPAASAGETHWRTFHGGGIAFRYPAKWQAYHYEVMTTFSTFFAYLGSSNVQNWCVQSIGSTACPSIDRPMPRSAIVVGWSANSFPEWTLSTAKGRRITVDGRPAKLRVGSNPIGDCPANTQQSIDLTIAATVPDTSYDMAACIRGPGVKGFTAHVMTMIRSARGFG